MSAPSTPAPISEPNSEAKPEALSLSFEAEALWIQYKSSILGLVGVFTLGLAGYGISAWNANRQAEVAAEAFSKASTAAELSEFIKSHPKSPLAGNASLLISEKLRSEGKYAEAAEAIRALSENANHPLSSAARLGLASLLDLQGKPEEALTAYRALVTSDMRGFATPAAWLRIARILKAQDKKEEAKSAYESLQSQFPRSIFANEALVEAQELIPPPEAKPEAKPEAAAAQPSEKAATPASATPR